MTRIESYTDGVLTASTVAPVANDRALDPAAQAFSAAFNFSAVSTVQDGWLVKKLDVSAGAASPLTYWKGVGLQIDHDGAGNLDLFWGSVTHTATGEVGLFIGDITGSAGGNLYGTHTRLTADTVSPAMIAGHYAELAASVTRGSGHKWYGMLVRNSGAAKASSGLQVEATGAGKFDFGVNIDATAADSAGSAIRVGGGWANFLLFRDAGDTTTLFRITSSGRVDATAGGITSKYTSGATQPSYVTNGHVEVWHDTGSGTSYLVVNAGGASKKVALA